MSSSISWFGPKKAAGSRPACRNGSRCGGMNSRPSAEGGGWGGGGKFGGNLKGCCCPGRGGGGSIPMYSGGIISSSIDLKLEKKLNIFEALSDRI